MTQLWDRLGLDSYDLRARMLPVYIAIAPAIVAVAALLPTGLNLPLAGASALVFVALSYAGSQVAADWGKRLEKGLWRKWDGPPTTRFLRHGNSEFNAVTRDRIHTELRKMGLVVPSEDEQVRDSDVSDALWVACTEDLIRRTRDRARYPLVFEGLMQYGFRRNLLGLKSVGLPVSVAALMACSWTAWVERLGESAVVVAAVYWLLCGGIVLTWVLWVRESTVSVAANRYARYLLEAALDRGYLNTVDHHCRELARLIRSDGSVLAQRHAPRTTRSPALHDVGDSPGGIEPHAEARQVPVPDHAWVAMLGQSVHHALGDFLSREFGHRKTENPWSFDCSKRVSKPQASGIVVKRIGACCRRERKHEAAEMCAEKD